MQKQNISKFLAYVLRHNPQKYGIEVDKEGYAQVKVIIEAIYKKFKVNFTKEQLKEIIEDLQERQRFEIEGDKIRALYGHSNVEISYPQASYISPPKFLYHGTTNNTLPRILKEGLKPMKRRFVHLCKNIDEAYKIGRRYIDKPVILVIDAPGAYNCGTKFILPKEPIYLAEFVPKEFIYILQDKKAKIREEIWHLLEKRKLIYSSS